MAKANGSGDQRRQEDTPDPERTVRTWPVREVVDEWFSDSDDRPNGGK